MVRITGRARTLGAPLSDAALASLVLDPLRQGRGADWLASIGGLRALCDVTPAVVARTTGLPEPEAQRLWAAIELGRRAWAEPSVCSGTMDTPERMADLIVAPLRGSPVEELHVAYLDARLRLIELRCLGVGSDACVVVEPREILRLGLLLRARNLVLAHNHPSGDPEPSHQDLSMTRRLAELCVAMGLHLVDHLVVGRGGWVSLRAAGHYHPTASTVPNYLF